MSARRGPSWLTLIGAYAACALACVVVLYPVLLVVKKAIEPGTSFSLSPSPLPSDVTLDHFRDVLGARGEHGELLFLRQAINSIVCAALTTVIGVALSCTCAYALSRLRFPGQRAGLGMFLVVQMFPATLLLLPLYVLLDRLHLLGSLLGLVLVYATTAIPFCVWNLKSYFDAIPRELEEAARVDGASPWVTFRKVILPLVRPGLAITALFSFMTAWNEFIMASTFMTEERQYTLPVLVQSSVGQFSADWGRFAAGALLTSLPVIILFYVLQRFLTGGLTSGAVKG